MTRIAMKFSSATAALNCNIILFGTYFFPIYLDLKLTLDQILPEKKHDCFYMTMLLSQKLCGQ